MPDASTTTRPNNAKRYSRILQANLPAELRVLWAYLLDRQGRNRVAWPSVPTIAADLKLCGRTIRRWIQQGEACGIVTVERRRGTPNLYRVALPESILSADGALLRPPKSKDSTVPTSAESKDTRVPTVRTPVSPLVRTQLWPPNLLREPTQELTQGAACAAPPADQQGILLPDDRPGKGKKPQTAGTKPDLAPDPRVSELIAYFSERFEAVRGHKPRIVGGRDGRLLKDLLTTEPLGLVKQCIEAMLADAKYGRSHASIPLLLSQWDTWRSAGNGQASGRFRPVASEPAKYAHLSERFE